MELRLSIKMPVEKRWYYLRQTLRAEPIAGRMMDIATRVGKSIVVTEEPEEKYKIASGGNALQYKSK